MSGLREDREFGDELVRGIRVLWRAQVLLAHDLVGAGVASDEALTGSSVEPAAATAGNAGSHRDRCRPQH
ncbi:MAG TPA: hypothetical protein DIT18_18850 [Pseudomonas sp.]|nr:hypothetical protein [Pseudomonas sp.]